MSAKIKVSLSRECAEMLAHYFEADIANCFPDSVPKGKELSDACIELRWANKIREGGYVRVTRKTFDMIMDELVSVYCASDFGVDWHCTGEK